ncbi:MAG: class I SAM-dependent methyltransferase [Elusimicrobia bacterium]|nr:class I SAM-dependent methyltransferase [Elusimicrobiota bacterium]
MGDLTDNINSRYEQFYGKRTGLRVYPTEFVVRTFLANYPNLTFPKPSPGNRVLDVGFGDGRNTIFLCDQGFAVSGTEITQGIVDQTKARVQRLGFRADLKVGRNSHLPFGDEFFDYLLACHCCYYCDEGVSFSDNLNEYARVLKSGAYLVASVASRSSFIFDQAVALDDGSLVVKLDPYGNRNGYRLQAFDTKEQIRDYFSRWFSNFSFGYADNDYYGISERVFWVVCQRI